MKGIFISYRRQDSQSAAGRLADHLREHMAVVPIFQDVEGGKYRIMQQGWQVAFQGTSIHGPVTGAGMVQGNQFSFSYTVNGAPYQAALLLSPDGLYLRGQYRSPTTGENGLVALQRIQ